MSETAFKVLSVSKVKKSYQLSETSATNGPQGTVSKKTQVSVSLLKKEMCRLYRNEVNVNLPFVDDMLLETLLTTEVENLHVLNIRHLRYLHMRRILEQFARNLCNTHLDGQQSTTSMTNPTIRFLILPHTIQFLNLPGPFLL